MSIVKPLLRSLLKTFLQYLNEEQQLKFRKIHKPVDEMNKSQLIEAIQLIERTLDNNNIHPINILEDAVNTVQIN